MSRDWLLYLDDMIASAEKIGRFVAGKTCASFVADEMSFDAVLFNLQIIGEAYKNIPQDVWPEATSAGPARLRDLIAHHYFALDAEIIWEVATVHVPALLIMAQELLAKSEPDQTR